MVIVIFRDRPLSYVLQMESSQASRWYFVQRIRTYSCNPAANGSLSAVIQLLIIISSCIMYVHLAGNCGDKLLLGVCLSASCIHSSTNFPLTWNKCDLDVSDAARGD